MVRPRRTCKVSSRAESWPRPVERERERERKGGRKEEVEKTVSARWEASIEFQSKKTSERHSRTAGAALSYTAAGPFFRAITVAASAQLQHVSCAVLYRSR